MTDTIQVRWPKGSVATIPLSEVSSIEMTRETMDRGPSHRSFITSTRLTVHTHSGYVSVDDPDPAMVDSIMKVFEHWLVRNRPFVHDSRIFD